MFQTNKNYTNVKAFLIARVSDPSQREALPAQKYKLTDYATRLGLDAEYHEFDESAFKDDRRKFEQIVQQILKYPKLCLVVFDKIDRFTRDCSSEIVSKLKRAAADGNVELHFASDGLQIHSHSPATDWFRLDIGMATAGYYSSAIRDNVNRRKDQKLRDGEYPGMAPIGYLNTEIDGKKDIIIDKMREPFIKKAFEMRLSGASLNTITREMHRLGLSTSKSPSKTVSKSTLENMFNNPFYYGVMKFGDFTGPHKYPTYITKSEFDEIQRINSSNSTQKIQQKTHYPFIFKTILKCGFCGRTMSSYTQKGRVYMHCASFAKHKCINNTSELKVLAQLEPAFIKLNISKSLAQRICDEINQNHQRAQELREAQEKKLRADYDRLMSHKDLMYEDRLDGRITVDDYDKLIKKDAAEMQKIDDELMHLAERVEDDQITVSNLLKLATHARELFQSSKPAVQNQLLQLLVSNLKIKQNQLDFTLLEPFTYLQKMDSRPVWLPGPGLRAATPPSVVGRRLK